MPSFMKILLMGTDCSMRTGGRTDRREELKKPHFAILWKMPKKLAHVDLSYLITSLNVTAGSKGGFMRLGESALCPTSWTEPTAPPPHDLTGIWRTRRMTNYRVNHIKPICTTVESKPGLCDKKPATNQLGSLIIVWEKQRWWEQNTTDKIN
jgi:hypothetical protein